MNTFYFNTGVNPLRVANFPYEYHKKVGNVIRGTLLIPFDCDAPESASFMYACDNDKLHEGTENVKAFEIFNSNLSSKFAYFILN